MPHLIRTFCFVSATAISFSFCHADDPHHPVPFEPDRVPTKPEPVCVVANPRVHDLVTSWTDASVECLFDNGCDTLKCDARMPSPVISVARMLQARCYVYSPCDELPIEAIYRERLANHGVRIIHLQPPSQWRSMEDRNQIQQQSLLAALKY